MRRSVLWVLFVAILSALLVLGTSSTAMAGAKKAHAGASYKKFHVTKSGKPKAPKYVPKAKARKARADAGKAKKHS